MSNIFEQIANEQDHEDAEYAAWALGDYDANPCENCGRSRVCICPNGKHRCEKCNWCPEDKTFIDLRF